MPVYALFGLCFYTEVESMSLQCSILKRASRSLAKTGLFLVSLGSLFRVCFCASFLRGPWWPFLFIWLPFGSILSSFWCNFGDFLRMGGICENMCFTIVKQWFLRVRGIPDRSFFLMFFRCCFWVLLFSCFYAFYTFFGAHGLPNGLL